MRAVGLAPGHRGGEREDRLVVAQLGLDGVASVAPHTVWRELADHDTIRALATAIAAGEADAAHALARDLLERSIPEA